MSPEENNFKKNVFYALSFVTIFALAAMGCYYFIIDSWQFALTDISFAVALLLNAIGYKKFKRLNISVRIGLGLGALSIISIATFDQTIQNGIFLWFFTLPLVSIYLLGKKEGAFWTAFYFLFFVFIVYFRHEDVTIYLVRFLIAYIVVSLFSYCYEFLREKDHNEMRAAKKAKERMSEKLSRYLSPQIRDEIASGKTDAKIDSSRKELTFFFSDIVDFTETTDHLESEALAELLNNYLDEMSQIALKYKATIDKFIGDAIVAFLGAPRSLGVKEDAIQCVKMAIEMRDRMHFLREIWASKGISAPFHIRMGINTGYCTVGNFGCHERMDYTIIGTQVNLAARLEKKAETGQILISHQTYMLVRDEICCNKVADMNFKGIGYAVPAYQVTDLWTHIKTEKKIISYENTGCSIHVDLDKIPQDARQQVTTMLKSILTKLSDNFSLH
jgi:class 3 adenylate cyclase